MIPSGAAGKPGETGAENREAGVNPARAQRCEGDCLGGYH